MIDITYLTYEMIIHCLSCGKSVSSHSHACPYCFCEISDITLEMNGIETKSKIKERMRDLVLNFVHR